MNRQTVYTIINQNLVSFCASGASYDSMEAVSGNRFILDSAESQEDKQMLLDNYFNDIYALFLKKFTSFAIGIESQELDQKKLRDLLDELIKVKNMLHSNGVK